jgi:hypothetical protein
MKNFRKQSEIAEEVEGPKKVSDKSKVGEPAKSIKKKPVKPKPAI